MAPTENGFIVADISGMNLIYPSRGGVTTTTDMARYNFQTYVIVGVGRREKRERGEGVKRCVKLLFVRFD